jgi:hypothetical protein
MRTRRFGITAGALVLAATSSYLVTQAGAGASPVTVEIEVSCAEPEGTHRFDFSVTNGSAGDIELDDNNENVIDNPHFTVNSEDPVEVVFQNHNLTPGFTQPSQPLLLLPVIPSGVGVFQANYTATGGGPILGSINGTVTFESCTGGGTTTTTTTTPTTAPPAVDDSGADPVDAAPTFTG